MSYLFNNDVNIKNPVNQFSELQTIQRTPVVEVIPITGITELRDIVRTNNSGNATSDSTEIVLSTGTTTNSYSEIDTAERGRYLAGLGGEAGIGVRLLNDVTLFTGTAFAEWGYAKRSNGTIWDGAVFGIDSGGVFVQVVRNNITVHKEYSNNWNIDKLDGSGPSGINWSPFTGNIYQIEFTWYGYGDIVWNIVDTNPETLLQEKFPVHVFRPNEQTSIRIPNLPVHAYVSNGDQSTNYTMYIGGRQFSVIGPFNPVFRFITERVISFNTDTTLRPIISFKSKNDEQSLGVSKKIAGFDLKSETEDLYVEVRINTSVSNTQSFQIPGNHSNNEVSVLTDTTADTATGGIPIWAGNISVSGSNRGNVTASGESDRSGLSIDIPEDQICSILVATDTGTGTAKCTLRIREER